MIENKTMTARELALDMLIEILEKGRFCHVVERQALSKYQYLPKKDRALATRITEGVVERLLSVDYVINRVSKVKTDKMKPVIRNILRMGAYQILYMDRIPDSAACNEAVKLAVKRRFAGLKGFVNGVLRSVAREKEGLEFPDEETSLSIPAWLLSMWRQELGEEQALAVAKAMLKERPTCIRCNTDKEDMDRIVKSLAHQGVQVICLPDFDDILYIKDYDYLEALDAFSKGWIQVQDVSSSLVCRAAAPKEGDFVLDVCGAPGGKSLHMADRLKGTGMVEARDLTVQKVSLIEENISRSGFSNIRAKVWNALDPDEKMKGQADIVLADLPCSGLGIIGRKPDIKYRMTRDGCRELSDLQKEILSVVWEYVKPGGLLVYSTCTISRAENQENLEWILENFPFDAVDISGNVGTVFQEETAKKGYLQLLPGRHPSDGFFLAVLKRKQE